MATQKWREHRFGELVKAERAERRGWTQRELADRLADKGVTLHWTTIAKVEKGERSVRIDEAAAFADVFNCSVDHLLGRRARPAADRDFARRRFAEAVDDATRSVRVAARDITDRMGELDESDSKLSGAGQAAIDALDAAVGMLAHLGGAIAETRGGSAVWRATRIQGGDDA